VAGKDKNLVDKLGRIDKQTTRLEGSADKIARDNEYFDALERERKRKQRVILDSIGTGGNQVRPTVNPVVGTYQLPKERAKTEYLTPDQVYTKTLSPAVQDVLAKTKNSTYWLTAGEQERKAAFSAVEETFGKSMDVPWTDAFARHPDIALAAAVALNDGRVNPRQMKAVVDAVEVFDTTINLFQASSNETREYFLKNLSPAKQMSVFAFAEAFGQILQEQQIDAESIVEQPLEWYESMLKGFGTGLGNAFNALIEISEFAQHVYRASVQTGIEDYGFAFLSPSISGIMSNWDETAHGQMDEKSYKLLQDEYGAEFVDVIRDSVQARYSPDENAFGELLVKYQTDDKALAIIDKVMFNSSVFEGSELKEWELVHELLARTDAVHKGDLGNIVANQILPREKWGTSLEYTLLDKGTNAVGVFLGDPTLLAGKGVKAYQAFRWGVSRAAATGKLPQILARPSTQRLFSSLSEDLKKLHEAAGVKQKAAVRNQINTKYKKYGVTDEFIESISPFLAAPGRKFTPTDITDWMTQSDGLIQIISGQSARRVPLIPHMSATRKAWIEKVVLPVGGKVDLSKDRRAFTEALFGFSDDTDLSNLSALDQAEYLTNAGKEVVERTIRVFDSPQAIRGIANEYGVLDDSIRPAAIAGAKPAPKGSDFEFTSGALSGKYRHLGWSKQSVKSWRASTDRFLRLLDKAPTGNVIRVSDASDVETIRRWARTTFDKGFSDDLAEVWRIANPGQRRKIANGMFLTIFEAQGLRKGLSKEIDSFIDSFMVSGNRADEIYAAPIKRQSVDAQGRPLVDQNGSPVFEMLEPDNFNGYRSALHLYQTTDSIAVPNFAEVQRLSVKVGLLERLMGISWGRLAAGTTSAWNTINLAGPRHVQRSALEDWIGFVASGGRLADGIFGRRISRALRATEGRALSVFDDTAPVNNGIGRWLLGHLDEADVAAAKVAMEAGDVTATMTYVNKALARQKTVRGLQITTGTKSDTAVPDYVEKYQSGGVGHLLGDESKSVVGMVKVSTLRKYLEYDRRNPAEAIAGRSEETINSIKDDISSGKGIYEPLVLDYNPETLQGLISEGNHRLIAAIESGLEYVPVRVFRSRRVSEASAGAPLKLSDDANFVVNGQPGYVPSAIHPYHFEELRFAKQSKLAARGLSISKGGGLTPMQERAIAALMREPEGLKMMDEVAEGAANAYAPSLTQLVKTEFDSRGRISTFRRGTGARQQVDGYEKVSFFDSDTNSYMRWHGLLSRIFDGAPGVGDGRPAQIVFSSMFRVGRGQNIDKVKDKTVQKLVEYFNSEAGSIWYSRLSALSEDKAATVYQFAERYFLDTAHLLTNGNGKPNRALLKSMQQVSPETGARFASMKSVSIDDLTALAPTSGLRPKTLIAPKLVDMDDTTGIFQHIENGTWEILGDMISRWSREPIWMANYVTEFENLQPIFKNLVDNGFSDAAAESMITRLAANRSSQLTLSYVDNPNVRSMLAWNVRNISRYYRATEDFYRRVLRLVKYNPESVQKGNLIYASLDHSGFIHEDDQGEKYFIYPATAPLANATAVAMQLFLGGAYGTGESIDIPNPFQFAAKINMLTPSADPESWLPTIASPFAAVPLKLITNIGPFQSFEKILFGPRGARPGSGSGLAYEVITSALPAPALRALGALSQDEREGQYASAVKNAIAISAYNGVFEGLKTEAERNEALERVKITAQGVLGLRFILGFVLPASPQTVPYEPISADLRNMGVSSLRRGYTDLLNKYDGDAEKATATWYRLNPNLLPFTVGITETGKQKYPNLAEKSFNWMQENKDVIKDFPVASVFAIPQGSDFSFDAYNLARSFGMIKGKDFDTMLRDVITTKDYMSYMNLKDSFDNQLKLATSTAARKALEQDWRNVKAGLFLQNPELDNRVQNISQKSSPAEKRDVVDEMQRMVAFIKEDKPQLYRKPIKQLESMLNLYNSMMGSIDALNGRTDRAGTETRSALRVDLKAILQNVAGDNRNAKDFYNNVLEPLIGGEE
jgi:hypothetical protein